MESSSCKLFAYLGAADGEFHLCVSSYELNPIGARVQKGKALPDIVRAFKVTDDPVLAMRALRAAQAYFEGQEEGLNVPVFGEELPLVRKVRAKSPPLLTE